MRRVLRRALRPLPLPPAAPPPPPTPQPAEGVVRGWRAAALAQAGNGAGWRADGAGWRARGAGDAPACACAAPEHCVCQLLRREDLFDPGAARVKCQCLQSNYVFCILLI